MIALLKKDLRLYRAALIGTITVILVPYLLAMPAVIWGIGVHSDLDSPANILGEAATFGMLGTIFIAGVFAGAAFALERREHWADFLALMPARKLNIIASKCLIAFAAIFIPFFVHCLVHTVVFYDQLEMNSDRPAPHTLLYSAVNLIFFNWIFPASGVILTFGVAWLLSTLIKSPSISAGLGIFAAPFVFIFLVNLFGPEAGRPHRLFVLIALVTGSAAFLAGTICTLKRVAP